MEEKNDFIELDNHCEICGNFEFEIFGCIKCGKSTCTDCIDGHISDWECICKECGW